MSHIKKLRWFYATRTLLLCAAAGLTACAGHRPVRTFSSPAGSQQQIIQVKNIEQKDRHCGPTALSIVLQWSGVQVGPDELVPLTYKPQLGGSLQRDLIGAARRLGRNAKAITPSLHGLKNELQAGRPVLILQNRGFRFMPAWHYAVVVGYDDSRDEFILHSGFKEPEKVSAGRFASDWQPSRNWGMVLTAGTFQLPFAAIINLVESSTLIVIMANSYAPSFNRLINGGV